MDQIVPQLKKATPIENYRLHLYFADGTEGVVNFDDARNLFEKNKLDFNKVSFNTSALVWSDEIEFDLLNCYITITNQTFEEYAGR